MKKVFTNADEVIHLFAQQTQHEARSTNVFFYGNKIYSYGHHYLLGEFIDDNTIMINDMGYSVTTSKHISSISWATRQYKQFFKTKTDLDSIKHSIDSYMKSLATARKPELYINPIFSLWESLHEYLKYINKLTAAKKDPRYKHIQKIVNKLKKDSEGLIDKLNKAAKEAKALKKAQDEANIKRGLKKFYDYEIDTFRIGEEDYLRLSKDRTKVETSQGIEIDVSEARLLYLRIQQGVDIKGVRISQYTVTSINGTLKIGCHNINMDSVHKVGQELLK